jgi:hypothetical protein
MMPIAIEGLRYRRTLPLNESVSVDGLLEVKEKNG